MLQSDKAKGKRLPPSPSIFAVTEDGPSADRAAFQYRLAMKYGDVVKIPGIFNYYAISHPDYIQQILQTNFKNYLKTDINYYRGLSNVLGKGMLSNHDTESWALHRKIIQPNFHIQRFPHYSKLTTECTLHRLQHWETLAQSGKPFDVAQEMLNLALDINVASLFSNDFKNENPTILEYIHLANYYVTHGYYLIPGLPLPKNLRFLYLRKKLKNIIKKVVEERRQNNTKPQNDLIGTLLAAQYASDIPRFTDQELLDEVLTFLITGHESTGVALGWTWYCLANNPECLQHLQEEIKSVLNGRVPTYEDLGNLNYTRMVFEETMRLYPPVWLTTRKAVEADEMGEFKIPAKSTVIISPFVMQRHPKYWNDPEKFDPLRHTSENSQYRPKYAYFPFGGGPRVCIGGSFVLMEAVLIIATIAQKFQLELVPNRKVKPLPLITLRTKNGIWMKVGSVYNSLG